MNALLSILSTNINIKLLFLNNVTKIRPNEQIVGIKYNGNTIAAGTGIFCKLEHHFLNTKLKRNKYFIRLAYLRREKKNHIWMSLESDLWGRSQIERRNCWCGNKLQTTDVELAQTFHPVLTRRSRRRGEVVEKVGPDVSSSLLWGVFPLLDVGDLQDGHQQLESILDVGSTIGRLRAERILLKRQIFQCAPTTCCLDRPNRL